MKKVLFMLINMNIGGVEKALLSMLSEMHVNKYDVTILLLEESGGFLALLPKWVNVQICNEYSKFKKYINESPQLIVKNLIRQKQYMDAINIMLSYSISKLKGNISFYYKYILSKFPDTSNTYDVAVAYAGPMDFITNYILYKVKAKKKIQWIHFDVTSIGFNRKYAAKMYSNFDRIFSVSLEAKVKLLNFIPNLKSKTQEFYNIVSEKLITQMASEGEGFQDNFAGKRILTVGRLSKEKGQDLTISVLKKLRAEGYNIRWYCIGDGSARPEYEQLIKESNLEESYILLGACINPFPYMKQCDIYVQSSRHEGFCITLAEARCFDNPIITTTFAGAHEQITHNKTGLVVECSEEKIYCALKRLLDDKELTELIKYNLRLQTVDTTSEIEKLFTVIDQ